MNYVVRPKLQLVFAIMALLCVYFPTISHDFSRFDDPFIVEYYGINSTVSFFDVITPGRSFYYRPLVDLSYWLDSRLWGLQPSFMHLENIAAHVVNVILVFLIASRLPGTSHVRSLPLLSALLFGLHPINSEPVNWIAGRTDIFAGMFLFSAFYCFIRAMEERSTRFVCFGFGLFLVAVLAKETAAMFIPAVLLLSLYWPSALKGDDALPYKAWRRRHITGPLAGVSSIGASIFAITYFRRSGDNALSMILDGSVDTLLKTVEAFGFYVKKFFLPLPLNAAIVEISPWYAILGILALCLLLLTFRQSGISGVSFAIAALFIVPALIVASVPIAWTPFGERYLYLPSAFAVIGILSLSRSFMDRRELSRYFLPVTCGVVLIASMVTVHRGTLWGDNFALMEDIIKKSPDFGVARNEYGILLKKKGLFAEAQAQFEIAAKKENPENVDRIIRLNLIGMKMQGKRPDEMRDILLAEIGDKPRGDVELLKLLYKFDEHALGRAGSIVERKKIVAGLLETNEILYRRTANAHYLYRSGQLALSVGDTPAAARQFRKAAEKAPGGAFYREPALKLAERLAAQ